MGNENVRGEKEMYTKRKRIKVSDKCLDIITLNRSRHLVHHWKEESQLFGC